MKEPIYLRREQPPESRERLSRRSDRHLLAVLAVTVVVWYVPYGEVILYPFAIFATWIHEICHGVVAFLLGGSFLKLIIAPDTSGYALYAGTFGSVGKTCVAAAGYMGTPLVGCLLLLLGRTRRPAVVLVVLGLVVALTTLLFVRPPTPEDRLATTAHQVDVATAGSYFGVVALGVWAGGLMALGISVSERTARFVVNFMAGQCCINSVLYIKYLFVVKGTQTTDAVRLASLVGLPYWFWAAVWLLFSMVAFYVALRATRH